MSPIAMPASTVTSHAPMYHRVVIRLLMACLLDPPRIWFLTGGTRLRTGLLELKSKWQGRKDSNPRPSVLETDALTRLSYAPMRLRNFTQPLQSRPDACPYHRIVAAGDMPALIVGDAHGDIG